MSSNADAPVRAVSEMLPANTAQAAAANAFARALLSPQNMLNSVGAQVSLSTLILTAGLNNPNVRRKKNSRHRGITLLVRPVRQRAREAARSLASKPPVATGDASKGAAGEGRNAAT